MTDFNDLMNSFASFFAKNWFSIVACIAVLVIGGILISLLSKLFMKIVYATPIDNAAGGFVVALIRVILWIALIFGAASILGINGNSFLVAFSSVALAIGLALKDSLANIANGIIIVTVKPFKKGDYVSVAGVEGTIKKIGILTTELTTYDNKRVVMPNSSITTANITNYSSNATRRVDFTASCSYDSDVKQVKEVLMAMVLEYRYALSTPSPMVFLAEQAPSSLDFRVRFWVNTKDYWDACNGLNEAVFLAFKSAGIAIPYNQLDVHLKNEDK